MTLDQFDKIRAKATWTEWRFPLNFDVKTRAVIIDVYTLLPDENVEAYLRDCPEPGHWSFIEPEAGEERRGFWVEPYERRQWYSECKIALSKTRRLGPQKALRYEKDCQETAFLSLVMCLQDVTDYLERKSDAEIAKMYEAFEKLKLAGPLAK